MDGQLELIHQRNTWLHFIGGYYDSESRFCREARKFGISRRVPAQMVRGMEFGDRLVFLRYVRRGASYAFAEGQIVGITLEGDIARQVGERLIAEGKAEYSEGGEVVSRACGSYLVLGTYQVKATLKETMAIAQEIHTERLRKQGENPGPMFVMLNARLVRAYKDPVYLSPSPKFTRSFIRSDDTSFTAPDDYAPERQVVAIDGYEKKKRPRKRLDQPLLPSAA